MKIKLVRNLRKSIKQGHPWIYKEAVEPPKAAIAKAQFCEVIDAKGELGWALYDPHGPLCLRMLSTDRKPPGKAFFDALMLKAYTLRKSVIQPQTTTYRLFNGEGDLLPGLVCDVYGTIAVLQFDGQGPSEYWNRTTIAEWILENTTCTTVVQKFRRSQSEKGVEHVGGVELSATALEKQVVSENGAVFVVNILRGHKTGFFLDQRDNRDFVRSHSRDKTVLNLFSYSGGFSIYAGLGGAREVTSVDIAEDAIALAGESWTLNGLSPEAHTGVSEDVNAFLKSTDKKWDHVICDPPSLTHSENQKQSAMSKYVEFFAAAALKVTRGGELSLSSCSSHITFEDFFDIIDESLSQARRTGQIVRVSGQGIDHPFPHSCHELRYLKFVHIILN